MSEANVEIVRRGLAAFNSERWGASVEMMHPDVEWHDAPGLPGGGVHRGRERVIAQWRDVTEALEGFFARPERFFDAGDQVVVFLRTGGRGSASGIDVDREIAQVFTIREGLITKVVGYDDRAEALAALGLSED